MTPNHKPSALTAQDFLDTAKILNQQKYDPNPGSILVHPQDMISMARALERNGDHDLAKIIKKKFPHLFPSEA